MRLIQTLQNKKTIFTRMCIGEAIIALLKDTDLRQLKILSVVKKAGVSRMTFYKYYSSTQAALEDYLQILIHGFLEEGTREKEHMDFLTYENILFAFHYFDRYRSFFLTMKKNGLYSILIDSVNRFVTEHIYTGEDALVYKAYSYSGSLLNSFLMWEEQGKKEKAEVVAGMIYELYGNKADFVQA